MKDRYLVEPILSDLRERKMVFLGGPRQVGKTTLACDLVAKEFSRIDVFSGGIRDISADKFLLGLI
jgi:hypothetical protein